MCGLFGAIGPGINSLIIRGLAIANRSRGKESLGMFDSTGKKIKSASDPTECLTRSNFSAFIARKHWFIAGHTRKSTRGTVNKKNAHPFRFGNYIGSHNGQVQAPINYAVDSQYLFDQLHKCKGNYAEAFKGIVGYWALTWFDGSHFYLQAHDNKLTLARIGKTWYYSSDKDHLSAAIGKADEWLTLEAGATIRFHKDGRLEKLEPFKSEAGRGGFNKRATTGYRTIGYGFKPDPAIPGYSVPATLRLQSPRSYDAEIIDHGDYRGGFDAPDYGYGRSSYNQQLTTSEYAEAEEWALECGYAGFYRYMKTEGYHNEYSAYSALARALEEQHDMEADDAEYEAWDAEQMEREAEGGEVEGFDEWCARRNKADSDYQQWSEDRQRSLDFTEHDGSAEDVMDAEFEYLCNRDELPCDGRLD